MGQKNVGARTSATSGSWICLGERQGENSKWSELLFRTCGPNIADPFDLPVEREKKRAKSRRICKPEIESFSCSGHRPGLLDPPKKT
jgi:hypothetical protein